MPLTAGSRLGPYEILAPIGAGGMGEVYKARDTRLDRTVAVKVLPPQLAASPESRQRFEREAKTISQLSHPHICALYDVGREGETEYLVMELLEGETLSDRLGKGALSLQQTLRYGTEIADALGKAHRQGIVHRDLKPGNVMLTTSGVKLLDFGLAKAMAPATQASSLTALPTQQALTQEGTILGTFQYMAPEQLEGKDADARTDVFAFGAVLYEMATGKKAFSASSQASLITAIMSADPPAISTVQPMSPPALDRVVKRCLAKDREDRWQNAADLASELKWIAESGSQAGIALPALPRRRRRDGLAWVLAALVGAAAALGVAHLVRRGASQSESGDPVLAAILLPEKAGFQNVAAPELSPDGRSIAFSSLDPSATAAIWVRGLGSDEARPIPGTEGANFAFWSPDGRSLGFFADKKLKRIDVAGGSAVVICGAPDSGRGGTWNADGVIVFSEGRGTGLSRVAASGGTPEPLTKLDAARGDASHRWPIFLPDGNHFLYFATPNSTPRGTIVFASLDGKESRAILEDTSNAAFAGGKLLFVRRNKLFAQPFDPGSGRLSGQPVAIADGVGFGFSLSRALFSASSGGILIYVPRPEAARSTLEWLDRSGRRVGVVGEALEWYQPTLSPDGKRLAVGIEDDRADQGSIWILDLAKGTRTRLTFGPGSAWNPIWSPDSQRVAYFRSSGSDKAPGIYVKAASGDGSEEEILGLASVPDVGDASISSWSPDGTTLVMAIFRAKAGANYDIWTLPLAGERKLRPLIQTPADENAATISPDGKWIAYESNENGAREVYVLAFPGPGGKFQISTRGGYMPRWRRDGKELFFFSAEDHLMSVEVRTTPSFDAGTPRDLSSRRLEVSAVDVAADGQRLLAQLPLPGSTLKSVRLLVDWPAELKSR